MGAHRLPGASPAGGNTVHSAFDRDAHSFQVKVRMKLAEDAGRRASAQVFANMLPTRKAWTWQHALAPRRRLLITARTAKTAAYIRSRTAAWVRGTPRHAGRPRSRSYPAALRLQ